MMPGAVPLWGPPGSLLAHVGHEAAETTSGWVTWSLALGIIAALGSLVTYWWFWHRRPDVNRFGLLWFALAMATLVVVMLPVVDSWVDESFAAHMVQHLLLWVAAPFLIMASHPLRTAQAGGFDLHAPVLVRLVHGHQPQRLMFAWTGIVVVMYGTHLTGIYDLALRSQWVHDLEHVAYLVTSLLFWSALLGFGRSQVGGRAVLALAVAAPMVFLGMIITTTDAVMYPTYLQESGFAGALTDQRNGGAIMWLGAMAAVAPTLLWLVWRWASNEHHRQLVLEQGEQG